MKSLHVPMKCEVFVSDKWLRRVSGRTDRDVPDHVRLPYVSESDRIGATGDVEMVTDDLDDWCSSNTEYYDF